MKIIPEELMRETRQAGNLKLFILPDLEKYCLLKPLPVAGSKG
jgi:hypothetical protein